MKSLQTCGESPCWTEDDWCEAGITTVELEATEAGKQRGGVAHYNRQPTDPWSCVLNSAYSTNGCQDAGEKHDGGAKEISFRIIPDPTAEENGAVAALYALAGEPGGCCGQQPGIEVGNAVAYPASGPHSSQGAVLRYRGELGEGGDDFFTFQMPGYILLSNKTLPTEWDLTTNGALTSSSPSFTVTTGDIEHEYAVTDASSSGTEYWFDKNLPLKRRYREIGEGEEDIAEYTYASSSTNGFKVTQQNSSVGDACIKYAYDESDRLSAIVACADRGADGCTTTNGESSATIRRMELEYDQHDRLVSWGAGCSGCGGGGGRTITYDTYDPEMGSFQRIAGIQDVEGNGLAIYHYDEGGTEPTAVYRGTDDAGTNGYMIVKEVEYVHDGSSTTKKIKLYVDNTHYEYIVETYSSPKTSVRRWALS